MFAATLITWIYIYIYIYIVFVLKKKKEKKRKEEKKKKELRGDWFGEFNGGGPTTLFKGKCLPFIIYIRDIYI